MSDDGFIYLRFVRNILEANGPVYTAGERMETTTDAIWAGLISMVKPFAPPVSMKYITVTPGLVIMAAALVLLWLSSSYGSVRRSTWSPQ